MPGSNSAGRRHLQTKGKSRMCLLSFHSQMLVINFNMKLGIGNNNVDYNEN